MRWPRISRPGAWFITAAALAVGAFMLAAGMGASDVPTARVLVASRPIPAGTVLGDDSAGSWLAVADIPAASLLPGVLTAVDEAAGRRTVAVLGVGEPITQASLGGDPRLAPAPLAADERAVPVPLRAAGAAAAAPVAGSRVDVIASDGEGPAGRTRIVAADAEVLAVTRAESEGGDVSGDAIVLRLSSAQALDVASALDFAREVRVVARPGDAP